MTNAPLAAAARPPLGVLSRLPDEVLVHSVLTHLTGNARHLRQFALTCRSARDKTSAAATYVLRSNLNDLMQGANVAANHGPQPTAVRSLRFGSEQVAGATTYLDGLAGRAQLAAGKRPVARCPDRAVRDLTYVLSRWPQTPGVQRDLNEARLRQAYAYHREQRFGDALDNCRQILAAPPCATEVYHLASDILRQRGAKAEAVDLFGQLPDAQRDSLDRVYFAELLIEVGDYAAVEVQLGHIGSRDRARHLASFFLGQCLLASGNPTTAEFCFRPDVIGRGQLDRSLTNFFVGEALFTQGRHEQANEQYRHVYVEEHPTFAAYLLSVPGSKRSKTFPLGRHLKTPTARLRVADALRAAGQFADAEAQYCRAREAGSTAPEAYYGLGSCQMQRHAFAEARASYAQAVALRPDYPEALSALQDAQDKTFTWEQFINYP